jgi:hypothetical protein
LQASDGSRLSDLSIGRVVSRHSDAIVESDFMAKNNIPRRLQIGDYTFIRSGSATLVGN